MEAKNTNVKKHHAIIFPLPLQGHINPAVNLSLKLASSKNFTITFLTFEFLHQDITRARPCVDSHINIFSRVRQGPNAVDIRYRVFSDGLPLEFDRTGKLEEFVGWYLDGGMFDQVEKEIEEVVLKSKPKVDVLIIDTFYPWASKIAKKFGLRLASFWTEPALVFNLYYHVNLLKQHGHFDCPDTRKDPIDYIPGVQSIEPHDLMSYLQDKDVSTNMHKLIFQAYQDVRQADYVLCNTVQELELDTISALQALMPFYAVGPIFPPVSPDHAVPTSLWTESSCLEWLGPKPNGSVLYVSFGSIANISKDDVMEIAYGLIESNVDFVWVLRPRTVLHEADLLPVGFEEVISGRGIIVPWTNQIVVLSHPAIGGFLTHCGWNSVLESIWYKIPTLCFPIFTDQFTNRKLVVDDWKVGINFGNKQPLKRMEIASQIKIFMSKEKRDELRENIDVIRKILGNALEADGSSSKNIDLFIEQLI
ncbi:UDP-glycosyltransferase 86A1-like [Chenopodium quinoa]|uniref:Glycosyltransferase n=1 Tax=Chenopodium quinoa TaxID=63459 RepID=A0A803M126_CHEQI|nr:UDP-glycosyltransferase 86A1-like [Chenopodium quinoa]